ncbi:MAG: hypothetical protein LHV68_06470 [Elusimicrobia bacterium]|nr:hypothetical protein [Candidatus Liberimonas magnetica]
MKNSELILLFIAVFAGLGSVGYIYILEPVFNTAALTGDVASRYKEYAALLEKKNELEAKAKQVLSSGYFKPDSQEQLTALSSLAGKIAQNSGIRQIASIYPLTALKKGRYEEIAVQIEMDCTLGSLTKMVHEIETSELPLKVRKLQITGETEDPKIIRVQIEVASLWIQTEEVQNR